MGHPPALDRPVLRATVPIMKSISKQESNVGVEWRKESLPERDNAQSFSRYNSNDEKRVANSEVETLESLILWVNNQKVDHDISLNET